MNLPLQESDYELTPILWREPESCTSDHENTILLQLDTLDGACWNSAWTMTTAAATTFRKRKK